jgi:hypothetical protein
MRYGPTDEQRPPHQDRHRDCGLCGAGGLQELDEAGRPESDSREFSGGQFGRSRTRAGELGRSGVHPSLGSRLISGRPGPGFLVRRAAAGDSLGDFTSPGATVADPKPNPADRDPEGQPLDVRPDELSWSAKRLAEAAGRDRGA